MTPAPVLATAAASAALVTAMDPVTATALAEALVPAAVMALAARMTALAPVARLRAGMVTGGRLA